MTVTQQLRIAVATSGRTRAEISRATGVSESILSRFVQNGRALRSDNIDALCKYLDLELGPKKARMAGTTRERR
ncbi:MAG TPA: helix-turn-helix transcriptional regulator [Phycisphaerales bacterium]|nr:helix-turn-helix transcriptional regulator [Phycisphaerales bacterium]